MDATTNPYSQWLGLSDVQQRPDHYTLLGLSQFEGDTSTIKIAADRATARVRSFRPGNQARDWARLLDEIDEARKCLMDDAARSAYDEQLRSGQSGPVSDSNPSGYGDMPQQPRYGPAGPAPDDAVAPATPSPVPNGDPSMFAPGHGPASVSADTIQPQPAQQISSPGPLPMGRNEVVSPGTPSPGVDPMAPVANYTPQSSMQGSAADPMAPVAHDANQGLTAQPVAGVDPMAPMAMPVGGSAPSPNAQPVAVGSPTAGTVSNAPIPVGSAAPNQESPDSAEASIQADEKLDRPAGGRGGSKKNLLIAGVGAAGALALGIVGILMFPPGGGSSDPSSNTPPSEPVAVNPADGEEPTGATPPEGEVDEPSSDPTAEPEPGPEPEPAPPVDLPEPEPEPTPDPDPIIPTPDPDPVEVGPPLVVPPDPEPPIPEPEPEPDPEPTPLTPAEKEALVAALTGARAAMGDRDQDAVIKHLAAAKELARTEEQEAMVKRLEELNHYVKEFWTSVDEAYSNLRPSTTIQIGTAEAAIVEVRPDVLILRYFGQNKTILRDKMPAGLAMAIADNWFTNDPANKVVKGALHAVDPNCRKDEARKLWQEAQAAGIDVTLLMPVLDDTYEF